MEAVKKMVDGSDHGDEIMGNLADFLDEMEGNWDKHSDDIKEMLKEVVESTKVTYIGRGIRRKAAIKIKKAEMEARMKLSKQLDTIFVCRLSPPGNRDTAWAFTANVNEHKLMGDKGKPEITEGSGAEDSFNMDTLELTETV